MINRLFLTPILFVIGCVCQAQDYTISPESIPTTIEAGTTASIKFNYTAAAATTYEVTVYKTLDGVEPDFGNSVGGTFMQGNLDAAATATEFELMVPIAGTTPPSSTFTEPEGYILFLKIIDGSGGDVVLSPKPIIEITEATNITDGILSTSFPDSAAPESSIPVSFNYVASMAGTYQIQLFKTLNGSSPDFESPAVSDNFTGDIAAAATETNFEIMATIPPDLPPSSTFTAPEGYIWFIKMIVNGIEYQPVTLPTLEVLTPLGINETKFDQNQIFFNNVSNLLTIQDKFSNKSLDIFDIKGQKIKTINNISSSKVVDLSSIPNGLYIAKSDNKYLKFVR